ncbi:phosphoribosylglycinamide formyltransferase [Thiobacter aerophilum]|uniref:Phosphoribosylglycinamide formyltransferase n=1 Tax=Thiobacter aerophilum TaxID=3121275 RepID=A0ABV0EGN2_9BURK
MKSLVVLISGRGSNLRAILDAGLPARIAAVISNNPGAAGFAFARERNIVTRVVDHRGHARREDFDGALQATIDEYAPDLVVLAGFMRVLTPAFVTHYQGRLINIHPSLLPLFPGLDTHRRALAAGVRIHGCTVHFVTPTVDHGPIIAQAAVPVREDDTPEVLAARVLEQEHRLYPQVIRWFLEGRIHLTPEGRVEVHGVDAPDAALLVPWS